MNPSVLCLASSLLLTTSIFGQSFSPERYHEKDEHIQSLLKAESYEAARAAITEQLNYLRETGVYDSLYNYVYDYGRSVRKTAGADQSTALTESLYREILKFDADTAHWLDAMEDASMTYYENNEGAIRYAMDEDFIAMAKLYSQSTQEQLSVGHYNLGFNFLELGKPNDAISHFQASVDVLDPEDSKSTRSLVNGWNAIGATLWRNGHMEKAKAAFRKSLHFIEDLDDPYVVLGNKSNCLGNLSLIFQDEGQLITAREILLEGIETRKKAIELGKELGHDPAQNDQHQKMLISNYRNLASIYLNMGDNSRALRITEHLHAMQKDLLDPDDPSFALTDESFGSIYAAMQKYPEALHYLERYAKFCETYYGRESFYSGTAYKRLGNTYLDQGNYQAALDALDDAVAIFRSVSENGFNQDLPGTLLFRSRTHRRLGDWSSAVADNWNAIYLYQQMRKENDPRIGEGFLALAQLHLDYNQIDSAEHAIDEAIRILVSYGEEILSANDRAIRNPVLYLPEAYWVQAQLTLKRAQGDGADSIAASQLDRAIDILRNTRNVYEGEEAQLELYDSHKKVFNLALDVCFRRYQRSGDLKYLEQMLALNEERRTLLLRRQLSAFGSVQFHGVPDSVVSRERKLLGQLTGKFSIPDSTQNYRDIEGQYQELKSRIQRDYPGYYSLRFQEETADISSIRSSLLGSDHSMLQYISTGGHLYALLIGPEKAHLVELSVNGLAHMIDRYNHFIRHMELEPFAQVSVGMYRALFEPMADLIETQQILIVPDENLFSVNFETLIRPSKSRRIEYLIHDYNISYLLSATSAVQFNRLIPQEKTGVLAFAPGFSDELKQAYRAQSADTSLFDEDYLHCIQQPFAVRAAQNVAGLMSGHAYTGSAATEQQFKEQSDQFRIIHLGTHTQINNNSPMLSRLILAKAHGDSARQEDGYLHAYEIYNMPLRAELAVLTACETGVGQESQSEGVLSLSHSFTYAGCPSIIMSLWQIDEKTSSQIIGKFYEFLSSGSSKSAALRNAKLEYLKNASGELAAPYFWAGMVLVGNPDPIGTGSGTFIWWILGIVVIGLLALFIFRRLK